MKPEEQMEKQGIIDEEHTPPESPNESEGTAELEKHATKRLAEVAKEDTKPN